MMPALPLDAPSPGAFGSRRGHAPPVSCNRSATQVPTIPAPSITTLLFSDRIDHDRFVETVTIVAARAAHQRTVTRGWFSRGRRGTQTAPPSSRRCLRGAETTKGAARFSLSVPAGVQTPTSRVCTHPKLELNRHILARAPAIQGPRGRPRCPAPRGPRAKVESNQVPLGPCAASVTPVCRQFTRPGAPPNFASPLGCAWSAGSRRRLDATAALAEARGAGANLCALLLSFHLRVAPARSRGVTGACVCDGSGVKWPRVG